MLLVEIALAVLLLLMIVQIILTLKSHAAGTDQPERIGKQIERSEAALKMEFSSSRSEAAQYARHLREETANTLNRLIQTNEEKLELLRHTIEGKLQQLQTGIDLHNKDNRKELRDNLDLFKQELNGALREFANRQQEQFGALKETQQLQHTAHADKLGGMSLTIEKSLRALQEDNAAKLEQMRATVDEKLQKTLETRLSQSFEQVSKHLESVQQGLGEMRQLAAGVGDLKKVLTNVKTRGVLGEYQLEQLLEQLLTPEQYAKNVKTKPGSNAHVEFAIRLPGQVQEGQIWMPVDSKFPREDFELLTTAYEAADPPAIETHRNNFAKSIRKCAADICDKYLAPPHTTDFGILFLPFESLYAEVLRTPGLFESIQREYRITITGPTTLSALLNSLQMGFRTLAISKRSGEVWSLLGAVKTEFGKFGEVLVRTQKKLQEASNAIDDAGRRSRAIERKLKDVTLLPEEEAGNLLNNLPDSIGEDPA